MRAGDRIPQTDGAVVTPTSDGVSIRAERHAVDPRMRECVFVRAGDRIPQPDGRERH